MATPDPYARTIFRGKLLDNATAARLRQAEEVLDYELSIMQGVGGAAASAGTHLGRSGEGGRAVDLAPWDHARKVRVLQDLGFAVWYRPARAGVWGAHVHAVLIFDGRDNRRGVAESAVRQIGSYDRRCDGLAGDGLDPNKYRPSPKRGFSMAQYQATFAKPPVRPVRTYVSRTRDRLVEAGAALDQAAALLDSASPRRVNAKAELDDIRRAARRVDEILERLPKR